MTKEVVNRYLIDDESLLWLEMERSATLVRRTSVLAIPSCLLSDLLALIQPTQASRGLENVSVVAGPIPLARNV